MLPPRHIALVGMAGVGKTSIGSRLARRCQRHFVDIDAAIVERAGRDIPAIFAQQGEPAFRRIESEVLAEVLAADVPCVVATGGGVVAAAENREVLAGRSVVVWLDATVDSLVERVSRSPQTRPLVAGDVRARVRALDAERRHHYAAVADVVVDTTERDRDEVVESVIEALRAAGVSS